MPAALSPEEKKAYQRRWMRDWRKANPERARAAKLKCNSRNRERFLARRRELDALPENRAKKAERFKRWADRKRAERAASHATWITNNPRCVLLSLYVVLRQLILAAERRRELARRRAAEVRVSHRTPEIMANQSAKIQWRNMSDEEVIAAKRKLDAQKSAARKDYFRQWAAKNRQRINELSNRRRREIRAGIRTAKPKTRTRWTNSEYRKQRAARDLNFKIKTSMSVNMQKRFARLKVAKAAATWKLIGCTVGELRQHIESHFEPGMTWDNYGFRGWHIDHKKPLSSYDLTLESEQLAAWHFSNLRPLWSHDNWSKGGKLDWQKAA